MARNPEDLSAEMAAAWNVHDARAFAALFAEDADFTNVFGMTAKGRGAIEAFHSPIFETMFSTSVLTPTSTHVRMIRPDIASVDVHWDMTGAIDPEGRPWPRRSGLISLVAVRSGATWSIAVMHNMDIADPAMAATQTKLQQQGAESSA